MKNYRFNFFMLIILLSFAAACSTAKESDEMEIGKKDSAHLQQTLTGCYEMGIGKDSAKLYLEHNDSLITGRLSYQPLEKDKSTGTIKGKLINNSLKTWYSFQSEGLTSVREVYFKVIDGTLAEGYGDVVMRNDSIFFKYPANLNYEQQHLYKRVECK